MGSWAHLLSEQVVQGVAGPNPASPTIPPPTREHAYTSLALNEARRAARPRAQSPVESLVRRLSTDPSDVESDDIHIPSFQRGYVWTKPQADRFIESLLLGLPVPGIFLWKDPSSQRLAIIDGSQRLRTLKFFYDGVIRGREFSLERVHR